MPRCGARGKTILIFQNLLHLLDFNQKQNEMASAETIRRFWLRRQQVCFTEKKVDFCFSGENLVYGTFFSLSGRRGTVGKIENSTDRHRNG